MRWLLLLLLTGCATTPPSAVRDADEAMAAQCRFVGEVSATSGWGGIAASHGIEAAKGSARTKAAALGATHIVWHPLGSAWSPAVSGRAYSCR